jgi:hypothetical protein
MSSMSGTVGYLFLREANVGLVCVVVEADYDDLFGHRILREVIFYFGYSYPGGSLDRESINSGADRGKCDRVDVVFQSQFETVSIAIGQIAILLILTAPPNGTHCMNYPVGRKVIPSG